MPAPSFPLVYRHQTLDDLPPNLDWLHPEESAFLEGLKFEKRRHDWLLGRWTAKRCIAAFLENEGIPFNPNTLAILRGPNGAPEMTFEDPVPACSLSISHRGGHAIAVVTPGKVAIGCDIELIEPRSPAFLSDYFLEKELETLSKVPGGQKDLYANLIWCVKESVMKATGEGMRLHPRKILVEIPEPVSLEGWNPAYAQVDSRAASFKGEWGREGDSVFSYVSEGVT